MRTDLRTMVMMPAVVLCSFTACRHAARQETQTLSPAEPSEVVEEFWPGGELRVRKEILSQPDGSVVEHGTFTQWYAGGQKEYEAEFVRGVLEGTEIRWHENGQKSTETEYVGGQRHGHRRVWDRAGALRKEEHFLDGQPHGTWTVWHPDGRIKAQSRFDKGVPLP